MEIDEENVCNGIKRKKPLALDWEELLPAASGDDDRPPELVVTSKNKSHEGGCGADEQENQKEDLELREKSDREIVDTIARIRKSLQTLGDKLPDKGEKFKANLRRNEIELERRKKLQLEKADNGGEGTRQLSDHSDDGAPCGKKKSDQKSSSSKFAKRFCNHMEENKDSRTVDAFDKDLTIINPCQGRKLKSKGQQVGKGRSKMGLSSSRSIKNPLAGGEKQLISNDDKNDGDATTTFSEPNSPQDPPSRNLRPRHRRTYDLVDEEPLVPTKLQYMETLEVPTKLQYMETLDPCMKDVHVYYPSRDDADSVEVNYTDMACLAPKAYISSIIMNFYIRYLQQPTSLPESATHNYHFFNTYFYNKLEKLSYKEDSFLKFRKWWKGVSIFEKAYIILPVHDNAHWSLVIICLPTKEDELGPILLHLDSLGLHNTKSLSENIRRFLKEEWSYLKKSETPLNLPIPSDIWENLDRRVDHKRVAVPQQKNDYDCGLFVLFYMERFIEEAPERLRKKDLSMFSRQWFHPREASKLRARIHDLLVEEFKKAKETETTSSPKC